MIPTMHTDLAREHQRRLIDEAAARALRHQARAAAPDMAGDSLHRPWRAVVAHWLRHVADMLDPRGGARNIHRSTPPLPSASRSAQPGGFRMAG